MSHSPMLDSAKRFVLEQFERLLVVGLVGSLLLIHTYLDENTAFLNFY